MKRILLKKYISKKNISKKKKMYKKSKKNRGGGVGALIAEGLNTIMNHPEKKKKFIREVIVPFLIAKNIINNE